MELGRYKVAFSITVPMLIKDLFNSINQYRQDVHDGIVDEGDGPKVGQHYLISDATQWPTLLNIRRHSMTNTT